MSENTIWPEWIDTVERRFDGDPDDFRRLYMQEFSPPEYVKMTRLEFDTIERTRGATGLRVWFDERDRPRVGDRMQPRYLDAYVEFVEEGYRD